MCRSWLELITALFQSHTPRRPQTTLGALRRLEPTRPDHFPFSSELFFVGGQRCGWSRIVPIMQAGASLPIFKVDETKNLQQSPWPVKIEVTLATGCVRFWIQNPETGVNRALLAV